MELFDLISTLTAIDAPSGFEYKIAEKCTEFLRNCCTSVHTTKLGSVIGIKRCGRQNAPLIMLDAHIDQVGFMVKEITDGGFLKVCAIGGVDKRILPGCCVKILTETERFGVFVSKPPHLKNTQKSNLFTEMFIDAGLDKARAEQLIPIGTPVVFEDNGLIRMAENKICGRALDNRAGLATMLCVMERVKEVSLNVDIAAVCSSGEERGRTGAQTAAFELNPDCAVVLDVTHAKTPDSSYDDSFDMGQVMIGYGPTLDKKMAQRFISIAKALDIPYGLEVMESDTGTNSWTVQTSGGVPCALLSMPLRYMHTQNEVMSMTDIENTARLLSEYLISAKEV